MSLQHVHNTENGPLQYVPVVIFQHASDTRLEIEEVYSMLGHNRNETLSNLIKNLYFQDSIKFSPCMIVTILLKV